MYHNYIYLNLIYFSIDCIGLNLEIKISSSNGIGVKNVNRIVKGLKTYLTDWKNLLTHSIVGVAILLIALFAPVSPYIRIAFVGVVVVFNVIRMRYA